MAASGPPTSPIRLRPRLTTCGPAVGQTEILYERDASLLEHGELHAWAEVYLEGAGWCGYDPSRALAVAASHVAVAASSDPLLASPVSGTYRGSASAKMEFSISMQVE